MGYDILEKLVFVSFKRIITKKSHLKSLIFVENLLSSPLSKEKNSTTYNMSYLLNNWMNRKSLLLALTVPP